MTSSKAIRGCADCEGTGRAHELPSTTAHRECSAMSIRERRREVAVIRSMGFTSNAVLAMLLGESVILSTVGGLIGCMTAYLLLKFGLPAFNINTIPRLPRLIVYGTGVAATMGIVCPM